MERLEKLKPYDLINSPYRDMTGKMKTNPDGSIQYGWFMVEREDDMGNVTVCKITSQLNSKYTNGFCYTLSHVTHPFLLADSNVQCDKEQTLLREFCVKKGEVAMSCRVAIHKRQEAFAYLKINEQKKYLPAPKSKLFGDTGYESINKDMHNSTEEDDFVREFLSAKRREETNYKSWNKKGYL